MVYIHLFTSNKKPRIAAFRANHPPRLNDEVRYKGKIYIVTKIVWCWDEDPMPVLTGPTSTTSAQRVNILVAPA
jgi:hypothetical protein